MNQDSNRWATLITGSALWLLIPAYVGAQECFVFIACTPGQRCDDFNIFTFNEACHQLCDGSFCCYDTLGLASPCECDLECPSGTHCIDGSCLVETPTPGPPTPTRTASRTPTRTRTSTRTLTRTPTRTPTPRPAVEIQDASVQEADRDVSVSFVIILSRALDQPVTFGLTVSAGTATKGVDYEVLTGNGVVITNESDTITFGAVTIPANTTASGNLAMRIVGDNLIETNETFFVSLTVGPNFIGTDTSATGTILNDDFLTFPGRLGIAELTPQQGITRVGQHTPLTLTWTHPQRWRDLATLDLLLRDAQDVAIWLRFDEAANTFALVDPATGNPGVGVPPRSSAELSSALVTLLVSESGWQEADPDDPRVDLTFGLRFTSEARSTYQVEAAATDDTGAGQELETVGTISVVAPLPCPGDCSENGAVSVDEVLLGLSIALGRSSLAACPAFDLRPDGTVDVAEIVTGVRSALHGCGA